ncbi:MAG: hypothetical protein AAGA77_25220 [Bacteroidota bacterium]
MKFGGYKMLILAACVVVSCSMQVLDDHIKGQNDLEFLAKLKYQDFFDASFTLDYQLLLSYRSIERKLEEGIVLRDYYNVLALLESYLGNYYLSIETTDKARLQPTEMITFHDDGTTSKSNFYPEAAYSSFPDSIIRANYLKKEFDDLLENLSDSIQVFALNEAHTVSLFRSTLYRSLPLLKKKGFTYLVLETLFEEKTAEHNSSSYPLRNSGFFSSETLMGDIIRKAKELDFTLISYDPQIREQSKQEREEMAFKNIENRILKKDPNAKIVLYAGHSHISETPIGRINPLGVKFLELGIDPLTINQIDYYERNVPGDIQQPLIFQLNSTRQIEKNRYDVLLVQPKSSPENGRPDWLWKMNRIPVKIDKKKIKTTSEPFLIEAFIKGESKDGVPLDRVEIRNKEKLPSLALRSGIYLIRITSKTNEVKEYEIEVK